MADGKLVLGLDIGSNSIGWALLDMGDDEPTGIRDSGVRVFEAGLEGLQTDGKGESRNIARRTARLARRRLERLGRRVEHLGGLLQRAGLLPPGDIELPEKRHEYFEALDKELDDPYRLRARALDERLTPMEFGRALYHIGQRRGFLSNKKEEARAEDKGDKELGKVKQGISELEDEMEKAGARTLGEYFANIDPHEKRIRKRYTARKMYLDEFEKIWEAQRTHHPAILTDDLKKLVRSAIFYQRPLKNQKHLIGMCELEPGQRRAPWALLSAQRFRMLQKVNDLRIEDGTDSHGLTQEQRKQLIDALEERGDIEFSKICKLPAFKGLKKDCFNLEAGGEKKIPGNRAAAKLIKIFGPRWHDFTETERERIVDDVRSIVKDDAQMRRGMKAWGLDEKQAGAFGKLALEDEHCNFSRRAIDALLPHLERGIQLQSAIRDMYPQRWDRDVEPLAELPQVIHDRRKKPYHSPYLPEIRNPIVLRALTELRVVVNAVIARHGKPSLVRIELARELRQSSKEREKTFKKMRENEKERTRSKDEIAKTLGLENPSPRDILRWQLADECGWHCPYTGRPISREALIGSNPQFDIEHIIPFDRSLDNSYLNKTLCYAEENRNVKKNRTPYEAYHGTQKWDDIIKRVTDFKGTAKTEKLKRFKFTEKEVEEYISEFSSRQLNDTRYASVYAKQYAGLLYGGVNSDGIGADGGRKVQAVTGQVTANVRNALGLNAILSDGPGKSRADHRHHAVDALVVALSSPAIVKSLSEAAKRAYGKRKNFEGLPMPWDGFVEQTREAVLKIVPSPRVSRRVRGALHQETFYGKPFEKDGKQCVRARTAVEKLTEKDIDLIVDERVREIVRERLAETGLPPAKAFKDAASHPFLVTKNGKRVPIHCVRIEWSQNVDTIGSGPTERHVILGSNHHMEIFEDVKSGKWDAAVVSLMEAYRRRNAKEPIVRRDHGEGKKFVFSLSGGEVIELVTEGGKRGLFVVRTVPQSKQLHFVPVTDARKLAEIGKKGLTGYPQTLKERHCQKVVVTPLGEVRRAND